MLYLSFIDNKTPLIYNDKANLLKDHTKETDMTYEVLVEGMMCEKCEKHVNDAVSNAFAVKKIKSSHKKGLTIIKTDSELDTDKLTSIINETGYTVKGITTK